MKICIVHSQHSLPFTSIKKSYAPKREGTNAKQRNDEIAISTRMAVPSFCHSAFIIIIIIIIIKEFTKFTGNAMPLRTANLNCFIR